MFQEDRLCSQLSAAGNIRLILGDRAGRQEILEQLARVGLLLLGFGALYYYDLGLTLMTKSWLLLGSGAVLLGARQGLKYLHGRKTS